MAASRRLALIVVATLMLLPWGRSAQAAAEDKTIRGKATAVTNVSLTVKVGERDMTFDVDAKTVVRSETAGRPMAADQPTRSPGKLTSLIQAGDTVVVTYRDVKGRNVALEIARVPPAR